MAYTRIKKAFEWFNYHRNGAWFLQLLMSTRLSKKVGLTKLQKFHRATKEIQRLLQEALDAGERFRAYGSAWSLSKIPFQKDRMHFNGHLNLKFAIHKAQLDHRSKYSAKQLFFFQCGNTIKEISESLRRRGQSLPTSGASNGQTIAGAISTGVHGSSIDQGGLQDSVIGLYLIVGPNEGDVVYLERASAPALSAASAKQFGARLVRSDEIFNAALVGLGAFGFIHAVVLQSVDIFLLKRYTQRIDKEQALQLAETLDFKNSTFTVEGETDAEGKGLRPYFYMNYINPYKGDGEFIAEVMYKKPYRDDYESPIPKVKNFQYLEITNWIALYASKINVGLTKLLSLLQGSVFPKLDEEAEGTLAEFFWDSTYKGRVISVSMGIGQQDIRKALEILSNLMKTAGPIPALAGIRFVKGSDATMAFTRFERTCILEFAGVNWEGSKKIISLSDFTKLLIEHLQMNGIAFTHHWGKNAHWQFPGLAEYMYGEKMGRWKAARYALLTEPMANLFENGFLDDLGLSGPEGLCKDTLDRLKLEGSDQLVV